MSKKAIWNNYRSDMMVFNGNNKRYLNLSNFLWIWSQYFPHVKIRRWKNLTGNLIS